MLILACLYGCRSLTEGLHVLEDSSYTVTFSNDSSIFAGSTTAALAISAFDVLPTAVL